MIKVPRMTLYDYNYKTLAILSSAYNIKESAKLGTLRTMTFDYPYYLAYGNGSMKFDGKGGLIKDPKIEKLVNEMLIEFNGQIYLIKDVKEVKSTDGTVKVKVECKGKADELGFRQVPYLNLDPPVHYPVTAIEALWHVITYANQYELGYGFKPVQMSGNTVKISVPNYDFADYTGKRITFFMHNEGNVINDVVVSYDFNNRIVTLSNSYAMDKFTSTDESPVEFRIHSSLYDVRNVQDILLSEDGDIIRRSFQFEDMSVLECLNEIGEKFGAYLAFEHTIDGGNYIDLIEDYGFHQYEFRYKKNIAGMSREIDSTSGCYTRVFPYGRNNSTINGKVDSTVRQDGDIVYDEHLIHRGDIYNFQYWLALGYSLEDCYKYFVRDMPFTEDAFDANYRVEFAD